MEYKYLSAWVEQNETQNQMFQEIARSQDQYAVRFKKTDQFLQISLASEDGFCFFTQKQELPFKTRKDLMKINQTLIGSRLNRILISDKDRIIKLEFTYLGLENKLQYYWLILELIPRFQNIILMEKNRSGDQVIIDSIKKFSFAENPNRQILPGQLYEPPSSVYQISRTAVKLPLIFDRQGKILTSGTRSEGYYRMDEILEDIFYEVILPNRLKKQRRAIEKEFLKKIAKKEKKIGKLNQELADTAKQELWKKRADLLKVNLDKLKPGMDFIRVKDYFSSTQEIIEIPVKKEISAQQNLNLLYKKYKKARDGKARIKEQIVKTKREIKELQAQLKIEIDRDLIFADKVETAKEKKRPARFRSLKVSSDWEILIGRTSQENDLLTTRVAKPYDWWFHTRIFKGTHVVLRNYNKKDYLPEHLLLICCRLAAYYSKAKKSSNVPVDYTQIRYVRKPRKSLPGYVIYTDQKTLYVDPLSFREAQRKIAKYRKDE